MGESELERIVVRLVGDGSQYQKMLSDAIEQTKRFGSQVIGVLGMFGVATSLKGAFDQFSRLEEGQIRLRNTIEATGQAVDPVMAKFKSLAEVISKHTLVTKGEVYQLAQRATMMGLNADQAEHVVKTSIALAGATGQDAESMLRAAAAMERGNYQLAQRMIMGRGVKLSEEELQRVVNNMAQGGWKTQQELADTTAGKMERLSRSLKSIGTEIGGMVSSALMPVVEWLEETFVPFVKSVWDGIKTAGKAAWEFVGNEVTYRIGVIKEAVTGWYHSFVFMLGHLGEYWQVWSLTAQKWVLQAFEFMGVSFNGTVTTIQNAWTRITQFLYSAWVTSIANIQDKMSQFGTWLSTSGVARAIYRWMGFSEDVINTTFTQMNHEQRNASAEVQANLQRDLERITQEANAAVDRRNEALARGPNNRQMIEGLNAQIDEINGRLAGAWRQYQAEVRNNATNIVRDAGDLGLRTGEEFSKGVKHGMEKIDAVVFGSAESFTRLAAYRDALTGEHSAGEAIRRGGGGGGVPALGVNGAQGNEALRALGMIVGNTARIAANPPVQLAPANLGAN